MIPIALLIERQIAQNVDGFRGLVVILLVIQSCVPCIPVFSLNCLVFCFPCIAFPNHKKEKQNWCIWIVETSLEMSASVNFIEILLYVARVFNWNCGTWFVLQFPNYWVKAYFLHDSWWFRLYFLSTPKSYTVIIQGSACTYNCFLECSCDALLLLLLFWIQVELFLWLLSFHYSSWPSICSDVLVTCFVQQTLQF